MNSINCHRDFPRWGYCKGNAVEYFSDNDQIWYQCHLCGSIIKINIKSGVRFYG